MDSYTFVNPIIAVLLGLARRTAARLKDCRRRHDYPVRRRVASCGGEASNRRRRHYCFRQHGLNLPVAADAALSVDPDTRLIHRSTSHPAFALYQPLNFPITLTACPCA